MCGPMVGRFRVAILALPLLGACQALSGLVDLETRTAGGADAASDSALADADEVKDASPSVDASAGDGTVADSAAVGDASDDARVVVDGGDAGGDARVDGATDASADVTADAAGLDAGLDAGFDAAFDAAVDAGFDSGFDAGLGPACTRQADCLGGGTCATGHCTVPPSCQGVPTTCGPANNETCCASPLITGPGGEVSFDLNNGGSAGPDSATLTEYRLDRYEVTVGRFRKFVAGYAAARSGTTAGAGSLPSLPKAPWAGGDETSHRTGWDTGWAGSMLSTGAAVESAAVACGSKYSASPGANDNVAMGCVSFFEAFLFCAWDGGRLATYAELMAASVGGDEQRAYPWGNASPTSLLSVFNTTEPATVGSRGAAAVGRYGHYDLAGNVAEHMMDSFTGSLPSNPCNNCVAVLPIPNRTSFGYSFEYPALSPFKGEVDSNPFFVGPFGFAPSPFANPARYSSIGFRCARYVD